MRYLRKFKESNFDDEVISHFSFLKDKGFNIFKPFAGRYVIHKLENRDGNYRITHFEVGEIKDDIMPILEIFNVKKITLSSYYDVEFDGDGKRISINEFDLLENNIRINRLFFDIG